MDVVDLGESFAKIDGYWSPRVVAEVNGFQVKLAKLYGEFVWHAHESEDELFLVVKGRLLLRFRDRDVWLDEGQCLAVPAGVEHCPVAPEEVHVLLFEPGTTVNTGNVRNERTRPAEWL